MSSQQHEREQGRIELEPVTCWPLILGASGFVGVGICALACFALRSALQPRLAPGPRPSDVAMAVPADQSQLDQPQKQEGPIVAFRPERQVIQKRTVEITYNPSPRRSEIEEKTAPSWAESRGQSFPAVVPQTKVKETKTASVAPAKPRPATPLILVEKGSWGADVLRASLWSASREVDLETVKGAGKKLFDESRAAMVAREKATGKDRPALTKTMTDLLAKRDDLRGLPLVGEDACQSSAKAVKTLAVVSRDTRSLERGRGRTTSIPSYYSDPLSGWLAMNREQHVKEPEHVGPLVQVCQVESDHAKLQLVQTLAATKGKEATRALADRCVFDLSPEVRKAALADLKTRPLDDVRPVLLAALRHPWSPAADHAAVALLELNDQKACGQLEKLVDAPDVGEPVKDGEKWHVGELVRVNHLRNCLLCHAPAASLRDPVSGPIPTPDRPLPVVYYSGRGSDPAVRADIVYLRQDFSAMHKVEKARPWPELQRFDYLVRKRELTAKEADTLAGKSKSPSPQREAALATLAELRRRQEAPVAK